MLVICISLVSVWELTLLVKLVQLLTDLYRESRVRYLIQANQICMFILQRSGLDPAYPGFAIEKTDARLDITDAQFVDVIHTNSALLFSGGLSFPKSIGHADFWPNGGSSQPVNSLNLFKFKYFIAKHIFSFTVTLCVL